MFKVICDVRTINLYTVNLPKGSLAPAVKKHEIVIKYENCQACDLANIKLTSAGENLSIESVNEILSIWDNNSLNPMNRQYHKAYEAILNQDPKNLKFIGIFTKDTGLTAPSVFGTALQVFEAIVDITLPQSDYSYDNYHTGYKQYHKKSSFLEFTNLDNNTLTFGVLEDHDNYKYITPSLTAYLLRHKGALSCEQVQYDRIIDEYFEYVTFKGEVYPIYHQSKSDMALYSYFEFLKKDFVEELKTVLFSFKKCKLNGLFGEMKAEYKKELCIEKNGKLESMYEVIDNLCGQQDEDYKLVGNNIFDINCGNYKALINFDAEGEILGVRVE